MKTKNKTSTEKNQKHVKPLSVMFTLTSILLLLTPATPQMTYKAKPLLPFLKLKLEKKLSTNYYMNPIIANQENFNAVCSSSLGPHCNFINQRNLNHQEEKKNRLYITEANKMMPDIRNVVNNLAKERRQYGVRSGDDLIFMNRKRLRLDQILFPKRYPRYHSYVFTFETFNLGSQDTLIAEGTQAFGSTVRGNKSSKKAQEGKKGKLYNKKKAKRSKKGEKKGKKDEEEGVVFFDLTKETLLDSSFHRLKFDFSLKVAIKNMWLPAKNLVRSSRAKIEKTLFPFLASDKTRELIRFGKLKPEDKHAMTKDKPGRFKYSIPVYFDFMFIKRNNKYTGQSYVVGKLNGATKFKFSVDLEHQVDWRRLFVQNKTLLDEIEVGPFLKVDNVQVKLDYAYVEQEYAEYFYNLKIESIYGAVPGVKIPSPFASGEDESAESSSGSVKKGQLSDKDRVRKLLKEKFGKDFVIPKEIEALLNSAAPGSAFSVMDAGDIFGGEFGGDDLKSIIKKNLRKSKKNKGTGKQGSRSTGRNSATKPTKEGSRVGGGEKASRSSKGRRKGGKDSKGIDGLIDLVKERVDQGRSDSYVLQQKIEQEIKERGMDDVKIDFDKIREMAKKYSKKIDLTDLENEENIAVIKQYFNEAFGAFDDAGLSREIKDELKDIAGLNINEIFAKAGLGKKSGGSKTSLKSKKSKKRDNGDFDQEVLGKLKEYGYDPESGEFIDEDKDEKRAGTKDSSKSFGKPDSRGKGKSEKQSKRGEKKAKKGKNKEKSGRSGKKGKGSLRGGWDKEGLHKLNKELQDSIDSIKEHLGDDLLGSVGGLMDKISGKREGSKKNGGKKKGKKGPSQSFKSLMKEVEGLLEGEGDELGKTVSSRKKEESRKQRSSEEEDVEVESLLEDL